MKKTRRTRKAPAPATLPLSIDSPLYAQFVGFTQRKGDIARAKIIASVTHCIAHLGIEATTFESVGKFCGMRRAHVAYYYPDLQELILAAVQLTIATAQQSTVAHVFNAASDRERLKAFCQGTFDWAEKNPDQVRVMLLFYYYSSWQPKYRTLHDEIRRLGAQRIAAVLKPLLPSASTKDLNEKAKFIQNLMTGALIDHLTTDSRGTFSAACDRFNELIHDVLDLASK